MTPLYYALYIIAGLVATIIVGLVSFIFKNLYKRLGKIEDTKYVEEPSCIRKEDEHKTEHARIKTNFCKKVEELKKNTKESEARIITFIKDSDAKTEENKKERHAFYWQTMTKLSDGFDGLAAKVEKLTGLAIKFDVLEKRLVKLEDYIENQKPYDTTHCGQ